MTEDEARQKWCPFARVFDAGMETPSPGNRIYDSFNDKLVIDGPACCIASDCAAWRTMRRPPTGPDDEQADRPFIGYCGLSGKP